jgi:tRNA A37 methylthiotransferase MiaB
MQIFFQKPPLLLELSGRRFWPCWFEEVADMYVINTCSVTENADKQFKRGQESNEAQ